MENDATGNFGLSMEDRLRKSRERVAEFTAESKAKARRAVRITDNYAHDHPWRMVITGSALAFIGGMLMRSRGRQKSRIRAPRKIVMKREIAAPSTNIKESKQSKFELIHALIPLVALGLKALTAARSHPNAHHRA